MQVAARIEIAPATATIDAIGGTVTFTARVFDQTNTLITGAAVTWTSANTAVATIGGQGLVTAVGNGSTRITAKSGNATAGVDVTVSQVAARLNIAPREAALSSIGQTVQLTAAVLDRNNHAVRGATVAWSSSDENVAVVSEQGLVTAVRNGSARITATSAGKSDSVQVTVTIPSPDRGALVSFFQATDGPNWTRNDNWLGSAPVDEWYGVTTDE